jgi:hypothetical protein
MSTINTKQTLIRLAHQADRPALARLAELDSAAPLEGSVLIAVVEGEARAALSLETGEAIADPFYPSEGLVALLRLRADLPVAA